MAARKSTPPSQNPPPHSFEAERAVIGAAILKSEVVEAVNLTPGAFYSTANGAIWREILRLNEAGTVPDIVTLQSALSGNRALEEAGGFSYLADFTSGVPDVNHAVYYAREVKKYFDKRRIIVACQSVEQLAREYDSNPLELINELNRLVGFESISSPSKTTGFTAKELSSQDFEPPKWAIKNFIPEGLTIIAGPPKIGKSWLALDIAFAVATGGQAGNSFQAEKGDVLCIALEDSPRRLKERLLKIASHGEQPENLYFHTAWQRMDRGGIGSLENWLSNHPLTRLVIIDTFQKIRPPSKSQSNIYGEDYSAMGQLKEIGDKFKVAIVVIHHLRKMGSSDPFERISGSTGLTGAADTLIALTRERSKSEAVMNVTGRDVEELELSLRFDPPTCKWEVLGKAEISRLSDERKDIVTLLNRSGAPMAPKEIVAKLGKSREAVQSLLLKMSAGDGPLVRIGGGNKTRYGLRA
jgi:hypothetical protein